MTEPRAARGPRHAAQDAEPAEAPVLAAVRRRRSHAKVTDEAPGTAQLQDLLAAMASVSDHAGLRPWRLIELRGDARDALGRALAEAAGAGADPDRLVAKARRAPLVLAVVVSPHASDSVPLWEQEAVAAGVGHLLGLLLHEAGWGSIWRTGPHTRSEAVHRAHRLRKREYLLGWLYVGGIPDRDRGARERRPLDVRRHLGSL